MPRADVWGGELTTRSDADGRYEFDNLSYGTYRIAAFSRGMVTVRHGRRPTKEPERSLEIREAERWDDVDFALTRGGTLEGRLVDAEGRPVIGASVRVVRPARDSGTVSAACACDCLRMKSRFVAETWPRRRGRFWFRGLPPGRYVVLAAADLEQGQATNPEVLERLRGRGTVLTLEGGESDTLTVTVLDEP